MARGNRSIALRWPSVGGGLLVMAYRPSVLQNFAKEKLMDCRSHVEIKRVYDLGAQPRKGERKVIGALWVLYQSDFYSSTVLGIIYTILQNEGNYNSSGRESTTVISAGTLLQCCEGNTATNHYVAVCDSVFKSEWRAFVQHSRVCL